MCLAPQSSLNKGIMVKVKICGITNLEDARQAITSGADALGFVFYSGSPRAVSVEQVREIVAELPPLVTLIGLFVNERPEQIERIVRDCKLHLAQLHGDEPPELLQSLGCPAFKALRVKDGASVAGHAAFEGPALLLDAWSPDHFGGTGESFDWQLAAGVARERPLILAGGLTPFNVAEAVRRVKPYAVDVSSGVETRPGKKDPELVRAFIRSAKEANDEL